MENKLFHNLQTAEWHTGAMGEFAEGKLSRFLLISSCEHMEFHVPAIIRGGKIILEHTRSYLVEDFGPEVLAYVRALPAAQPDLLVIAKKIVVTREDGTPARVEYPRRRERDERRYTTLISLLAR